MGRVKLRLHGSEMLASLNLHESYDVYTDSLWTSLFTIVGNEKAEPVTNIDYLMISQKFLRTDILKSAEKNIKSGKGDYLVVDMLNTAYAKMIEINNQLYTMSPVFLKSQYFKINKSNARYHDCLYMDFNEIKPYFDAYINMIKKYYSSDRIILVRTCYPEYYVYGNQIRPWNVSGNRREKINDMVKLLENYFIKALNPYVIGCVRYYYGGFDAKKGLFAANYEEECKNAIKRSIRYIINKKPASKVIYGYPLVRKYQRFGKFYDSILFFHEENLFINPKSFTDNLILKLNRRLILRYAEKFAEIRRDEPKSIDELLEREKLPIDLRTALLLIKAVEEKNYLNKMLPYERIFTDKLNIRNDILDDVRIYFSKFDNFDTNSVTMKNLQEYFDLMRLFMFENYNEICRLGYEKYEMNKNISTVKKFSLAKQNTVSEPKKEHNYYEAARYLILKQSEDFTEADFWGSAFGSEILDKLGTSVKINRRYIGSSPLFDFEEPIAHQEQYLEEVLQSTDDPFVEQLAHSLRRNIHSELEANHSEWLIVDLISLTGDCVKYKEDEACMRAPVSMRRMKTFLEAKPEDYLVCYSWEQDEEKIKNDMDLFISFAKRIYGDRIILIYGDIKSYYLDENGMLARYLDRTRENILSAKKFLFKWQNYFAEQTDCYCVDSIQYYFADSSTLSVSRRYHMEKEYYDDACGRIERILEGNAEKHEVTVKLADMVEKVRKVVRNCNASPAVLSENINYPKK